MQHLTVPELERQRGFYLELRGHAARRLREGDCTPKSRPHLERQTKNATRKLYEIDCLLKASQPSQPAAAVS